MKTDLSRAEKLCLFVAAIGLGLSIPGPFPVAQSAEAATVLMYSRWIGAIACILSGGALLYLRAKKSGNATPGI